MSSVAVFEVMAPQHAEKVFVHGHSNPFLSICFPFILQNTMCFEANMLTWRCMLLYAERRSLVDDKLMITHRANALNELQRSIAYDFVVSDAVALTVACLMCVEMFCGDFEAVRHHAQAVYDIRSQRQQSDSAVAQFVTGRLEHAEKLAHKYLRRDLPNHLPEFIAKSQPEHLSYPRGPLAPSLCRDTSSLPTGLLEIVMSESFSFTTIDCLLRLSRIRDPAVVGHEHSLPELRALRRIWEDIDSTYAAPAKTKIEHWLYFGLNGYCTQLDDELCHPSNQVMWIRQLIGPFTRLSDFQLEHQDCLLWIHLCFAGALGLCDNLQSNQIVDLLLCRFPRAHDWTHVEAVIHRFLHTQQMISRWKACWQSGLRRLAET